MRVRTAVGITTVIIIAEGAITWFAAKAWFAIPGRHWPPNRWHIELGNLSEALAAFAAVGAAFVALWIATRDRRDRMKQRDAEDEAQAKLVIVSAECPNSPLQLQIRVVNNAPRAIVDVTFVGIVVAGHDLDLQPTSGPYPPIGTPGNDSLFTFNPQADAYGPAHPYYIAIRGGPNGEPRTGPRNGEAAGAAPMKATTLNNRTPG